MPISAAVTCYLVSFVKTYDTQRVYWMSKSAGVSVFVITRTKINIKKLILRLAGIIHKVITRGFFEIIRTIPSAVELMVLKHSACNSNIMITL